MQDAGSKLLATLFAETRIYSVSQLNEQIKDVLEAEFFALQVQGEISNFKRHPSGHWYFTLKDTRAQLRGVFFRQWNRLLRFEPTNGLDVRVRGRLSVYEPRGEYQIVVETMEPVGIGAMQLAFEQQVKRLSAEGLFDEKHKQPLPRYPRRIGIITSPVGAVLRDILQILARRNPGLHILLIPVRVQGTGAGGEIADAIALANKFSRQKGCELDALIVGRGGGSAEDLWAFNEESVARAIFASKIPVLSAVGHETDYTIADFVADLRAPTPSAAAEMVAADAKSLLAQVEALERRLVQAMTRQLSQRRQSLFILLAELSQARPSVQRVALRYRDYELRAVRALNESVRSAQRRLSDSKRRLAQTDWRSILVYRRVKLETLEQRLQRAMKQQLDYSSHNLAIAGSKLEALSPLSVLARGYALVRDEQGNVVKQASSLSTGALLKLRFEDGETRCQVL